MRKFLLFIILVLFTATNVLGQKIPYTIKKSAIIKEEFKDSRHEYMEPDGKGGVIVFTSHKKGNPLNAKTGYYIEHYDENLNLIKDFNYEIELSKEDYYGHLLGIIVVNGEINLIYYTFNNSENTFTSYRLTADIDSFNFKRNQLFKLDNYEGNKYSFRPPLDNTGHFGTSMTTNADKTYFAITVEFAKEEKGKFKILLFDNEFNKTEEYDFNRDEKFNYMNIFIPKDGKNIYLFGWIFIEENKKWDRRRMELTRINKESQVSKIFDNKENFSSAFKSVILNDKLICIGFYTDEKDKDYKGISYFELSPLTLETIKSKFNAFSKKSISEIQPNKDSNAGLKNLKIKDLRIYNKGQIVLDIEEDYLVSSTKSTGYFNEDIIIVKTDESGNLESLKSIDKKQITYSSKNFESSYKSVLKNGNSYFFINAVDEKMKDGSIKYNRLKTKETNLSILRVSNEGIVDYEEILNFEDNEISFMVFNGILSKNNIYFIGKSDDKKQLLKVTLE